LLDAKLKIILLDYQNNYNSKTLKHDDVAAKSFNTLAKQFDKNQIVLINNYCDGPTKLFSNLYLAKFLNILANPFFSLYIKRRYFRMYFSHF